MNLNYLKKIRVVISLLFFIFTGFLFIDIGHLLSSGWVKVILFPQFVPSFIKFMNLPGLATCGFIIILIITLLFGRIYCSTVCPLGTLQDIINYLARKIGIRQNAHFTRPWIKLRYSILIITLVSIPAGSLIISLLDPYSNFGRIYTALIRPVCIYLNNLLAVLLEKVGLYWFFRVGAMHFDFSAFLFALVVFLMLIALASGNGRLFCNTVCPAGSLLGICSRISPVCFLVDNAVCTHCDKCELVCKSDCIDSQNSKIDMSRCVACFNCLDSCPSGCISYTNRLNPEPVKSVTMPDLTRRKHIKITLGALSVLSGIQVKGAIEGIIDNGVNSTVPVKRKYPVTPPGSLSIEYFGKNCTACHLCISQCPTQVLQPSLTEYGLEGIFQPFMDYNASYCNFECTLCGTVCPTGAILPVTAKEKKLLQLGKSVFIKENCIVEIKKTECGACSEHCPTKAVQMVPYLGKIKIPEINNKICVGCGACEYACPVKPYKAIYVEGNPVHLVAAKPEEKKAEKKVKVEDFPF